MFEVAVPLTILSIAYPFAPVGPDAVGGAEQILTVLDEALERRGHRSIVIAREGSVCRGTLFPLPAPENLGETGQARGHVHVREAIARALERFPVDVLHFHGVDFAAYLPATGPPALATLHLPLHLYPPQALFPKRPATWIHCVSESQQRACPPGAPMLPAIPNGVDLQSLYPGRRKRGFVLCLGRICKEKGFHLAMDAAKRAGVPLVLAGQVFPYEEHQRYFHDEIEPRLGSGVHFPGPLGLTRKRRLLAAARCLAVPSQTDETSSLVSREALACGTPVVAFRAGALPEVVDHGRTGFLTDSVEEMAQAIQDAGALDPAECRREAERRFSLDLMISRYLDAYRRVVREGRSVEAAHA
ncbi:MAG TPA: glycosyltransferase family 4 protein [Thermoanaerobaculia bacterium]|jgi:glycosyltransferase involved in cell wall biosynthesis|nr:glycosyltransferase family 4 protein [Thermoanaerobaculia bacterium]